MMTWVVELDEDCCAILVDQVMIDFLFRLHVDDLALCQLLVHVLSVHHPQLIADFEQDKRPKDPDGPHPPGHPLAEIRLFRIERLQEEWTILLTHQQHVILPFVQVVVLEDIVVDEGLIIDLPLQAFNLLEVHLSLLLVIQALLLLLLLLLHQLLIPLSLFDDLRLLDIADDLVVCFLDNEFVLF